MGSFTKSFYLTFRLTLRGQDPNCHAELDSVSILGAPSGSCRMTSGRYYTLTYVTFDSCLDYTIWRMERKEENLSDFRGGKPQKADRFYLINRI